MSGKSFTYAYTNASDYIVTLTVTDNASNTATDSILLHIHSPAVLFSCFINETCNSPYIPVLGLSAQDNAHAEIIGGGGNYPYKLCCKMSPLSRQQQEQEIATPLEQDSQV